MHQSIPLIPPIKLNQSHTIFDALSAIDGRYEMIAVVLDENDRLLGIVSPGDLRKAILGGHALNTPLTSVMNREPVCVRVSEIESRSDMTHVANQLMARFGNTEMLYAMIPVIGDDDRVCGLVSLASLNARMSDSPIGVRKRTVLVVGGAGYIGSVLARQLLRNGWRVKVLDKLLYSQNSLDALLSDENFTFIKGDAGVIDTIVEAVEGVDAVVYLAELVGDSACLHSPQAALKANYLSVTAMAHLCSHLNINRFIYTSSCSVYGASKSPDDFLTEESALEPVSLYARVKILAEQSILSVCKLPNALFAPTILRLSTVFGHSHRPRFDLVVNIFAKEAIQKGRIEIFGGDQWRPNIHVSDVGEAVIKILDAPIETVRGEIFNVGHTDMNYTINGLGDIAQEAFPGVAIVKRPDSPDRRNYRVDFSKIERQMAFRPLVSVREGMLEIKRAYERSEMTNLDDARYHNYRALQELTLA